LRLTLIVLGPVFEDPALSDEDDALREEARDLVNSKNNRAKAALLFLPALALLGLSLGAALLPLPGNLWPFLSNGIEARPLGTDLLAAMLLMELPVLATVLFGSLGGSIYSQLAGSRSAQLAVAYALPYTVALIGPSLVLGTFDFRAVVAADSPAMLGVKLICGLAWLICMPARLRLRPLAASPGETLEGVTNEIAGPPLGLFRLMEWTERVALTLFATILFVPWSYTNPLMLLGGVALGLGAIGVVDAFFSQVRLRDALNFYLRYANLGALAWFVVLAFLIKA
jgi:NADH:ubiquinone oxidoreductase subunit H